MNTGLQDAANLAWKLVAVRRYDAPEALLDTYESERLLVAREVLRFTDKVFNIAAGQTGWQSKLRGCAGTHHRRPHDEAQLRSGQGLPQVRADRYRLRSEYCRERSRQQAEGSEAGRAGSQCTNLASSGYLRSPFQLSLYVLALSRKRLTERDTVEVTGGLGGLSQKDRATHIVARLAIGRQDAVELVAKAEIFDRYGLVDDEAQALIVVRPNGHIAWRCDSLDFAGCREFLASLGGGGHSGQ
jgi:hypothetical protein